MIFKVLVSDRNFNMRAEVQNELQNLTWTWNRLGGCGAFSFSLPREFCRDVSVLTGDNVKIYIKNFSTNSYDLWYQGRVENHNHNVNKNLETVRISGDGYLSELRDIYVDRDYSSTEASAIVTDVLDNDITPNTNISYVGGDITATTFTPDTYEFNNNALNVMQTIADTVGSREWGVDENRKFFFKERSETVSHRYPLGSKVTNYVVDSSSNQIINRVVVIGGDVSGSPFTETFNDLKSQEKWKRRDKAIKNTAIVTSAVAQQFANSYFQEYSKIVRRARLDLISNDRIESSVPLGLAEVRAKSTTYGTRKYGTFQYSGALTYQINRIRYSIDTTGNLKQSLDLGKLRPDISESIGQLEYKIEQLQSQGV